MRTTSLVAGMALTLVTVSAPVHAQTPNTGSSGDVYASDGGAGARWWKQKAEQYPLCAAPANEGATLTGQIVEEAYKKPEDIDKVNELGAQREEVKRELQVCIAQNYRVKPPLQGGVKQDSPADPGANGPYEGGTTGTGSGGNGHPSTGNGGSGKPGTGKTAPPPKKQPPLSRGTKKSGGYTKKSSRPPMPGHPNTGPQSTPPQWVGKVDILWPLSRARSRCGLIRP